MHKKVWLSILAVTVLVGGIFLGVKAVSADTAGPGVMRGMMENGRVGGGIGVTQEALAAALGISTDDLQAAQSAALDKALEQAVAADLITQTQADLMKERSMPGLGMHMGGGFGGQIDFEALLAAELGITTDELQAARTVAHTTAIADAVAAGDLTQEQADLMLAHFALRNSEAFQTNMTTAYEDAINQALEDGTLTQAQADALLSNLESNGFFGGRGGFGRMGGMGGMHGGRGMGGMR